MSQIHGLHFRCGQVCDVLLKSVNINDRFVDVLIEISDFEACLIQLVLMFFFNVSKPFQILLLVFSILFKRNKFGVRGFNYLF